MDTSTKVLTREKTSDKLARQAMSETSDGLGTRLLIWLLRNKMARWLLFGGIVAIAGAVMWSMAYGQGHDNGCTSMRNAAKANGFDLTAKAPTGADSITIEGCIFKLESPAKPAQ